MKIDKLSDFNEVIKFYNYISDFMRNVRQKPNNIRSVVSNLLKSNTFFEMSGISSYRALANNLSLCISQVHEQTKDVDDELLEKVFLKEDLLKKITCKNEELSLKEIKRQIRNCLAHADYNLVFDEIQGIEGTNSFNEDVKGAYVMVYLNIENARIKGRITFEDLKEFAVSYNNAFAYMRHGDDVTFLLTKDNSKIRTIQDYIDNTKRVRVHRYLHTDGMPFNKMVYWITRRFKLTKDDSKIVEETLLQLNELERDFKSYDFEIEELRDSGKAFLEKYLRYVGIKEFLNNYAANRAFNEINASNNEQVVPIDLLVGMTSTIDKLKKYGNLIHMDIRSITSLFDYIKDEMGNIIKYSYQAPFIYANNLLGMANYVLNYTRETNEQSEEKLFDYYNIGSLDGIKATIKYGAGKTKEAPIEYNPYIRLQNRLNDVNNNLNKLIKDKEQKEKTKISLENPKNQNPKKQEILEDIEKWMNDFPKREEELVIQKKELEALLVEEVKKGTDNRDSSEFFRHIRNSLAHGNYTITYEDLNSLSTIKYVFNDEDERTGGTYSVELTAKQLEDILSAIQLKINECDRGYLDGKKVEREVIEYALRSMKVGQNDVDQAYIIDEIDKEEEKEGDEGVGKQDT